MKQELIKILEEANEEAGGQLIQTNIEKYVDKIFRNATIIPIIGNGTIKAFIAFYDNDISRETAYLTMIVVRRTERGKGLGKLLILLATEILRGKKFVNFTLEVHKENFGAKDLYKSLGFKFLKENEHSVYLNYSLRES